MSGLLAEYDIDLSNVEAPEYSGPADDIYEFTLGDVSLVASSKNPQNKFIVFSYLLGETGLTYKEWFGLPLDPASPTDKEIQKLGFYKQRLLSLGVSADDINTVTSDELVGTTGTFELRTTRAKNGNEYQNIKNFKANTGASSAPAAPVKAATAVDNPFA